jgi:ketosteroid isomerase-like protein
MILHDFFDAVTRFDDTALEAVMHPQARVSEMPNAINRNGTERGLAGARDAFARGRGLLAAQSFEIHEVIESGDRIAARATWRGTLAASGQELVAHIATFTQVRDGRIFRHATYDCYEPLGERLVRSDDPGR